MDNSSPGLGAHANKPSAKAGGLKELWQVAAPVFEHVVQKVFHVRASPSFKAPGVCCAVFLPPGVQYLQYDEPMQVVDRSTKLTLFVESISVRHISSYIVVLK